MSATTPTEDLLRDLPRLRALLGRTTAVWATELTVENGYVSAFTGAFSADYNIAICSAGMPRASLARGLTDIAALKAPSLIMVAGGALAEVQELVEAGWICVGAAPFMAMASTDAVDDSRVQRLTLPEYPAARALLEPTFGLPRELTEVALPDSIAEAQDKDLWGLYVNGKLVSCVATMNVEGILAPWSMATPAGHRRRGYGRALLSAALHRRQAEVNVALLSSSPDGLPFYEATGFVTLERWQLWSRRRWVIGRL